MVATRSGDFQLGLMLATALAVMLLPTAVEAYTPEGQRACTGDAFRLCSAEIPNVDRVRACLHRNKAQLSSGCRGSSAPGRTGRRRAPVERSSRQNCVCPGAIAVHIGSICSRQTSKQQASTS